MIKFRASLAGLWHSLFDIDQPPARYLGRALLIDLPFSIPLAFLIGWLVPGKAPDFGQPSVPTLLFGACVFAPVVETLLMILLFGLLRLMTQRLSILVPISALVWAGLHSLTAPAWGLGVLWPFFLFSLCYLRWETRSRAHGFGMTAALHALHNLPPVLMLVTGRLTG